MNIINEHKRSDDEKAVIYSEHNVRSVMQIVHVITTPAHSCVKHDQVSLFLRSNNPGSRHMLFVNGGQQNQHNCINSAGFLNEFDKTGDPPSIKTLNNYSNYARSKFRRNNKGSRQR